MQDSKSSTQKNLESVDNTLVYQPSQDQAFLDIVHIPQSKSSVEATHARMSLAEL